MTEELERVGAIGVCSARALRASARRPTSSSFSLTFTNVSNVACRLPAFPHLTLLGAHGRRLPTRVTDANAAQVRRQGLGAAVALDPGLQTGESVSFPSCEGRARSLRLHLKGMRGTLTVPVASLALCGGRLTVTQVEGGL